jgi:hypothetical protein
MKRELCALAIAGISGLGCSGEPSVNDTSSQGGVSAEASSEQHCSVYDPYLAALAELTVACRGTLDPRDFIVSSHAGVRPAFASCRADSSNLKKIRQLLSLQERADRLPRMKECITERVSAAQRQLNERGVASCPTWQRTRVINPIDAATTSLIETVLPVLPGNSEPELRTPIAGISRRSLTTLEPESEGEADSAGVFDLLQQNSLYSVSLGPEPQGCDSAASCASLCAAAFPGFVIGVKSDSEVVTDPIAWLLDTTYSAASKNPFLRGPYYHPMSYYGPLPGVFFGDYARFEPCGPDPEDPLCRPEQCSYFAGNHLKTFFAKGLPGPQRGRNLRLLLRAAPALSRHFIRDSQTMPTTLAVSTTSASRAMTRSAVRNPPASTRF